MGQNILCLSGRKQAGKDTCYNFLHKLVTRDHDFPGLYDGICQFNFAEPLKRMCIDILGCPEDKVFGTDEDKRTLVPHLLWENFPVPVWETSDGSVFVESGHLREPQRSYIHPEPDLCDGELGITRAYPYPNRRLCELKTGPMSVREVLQYWGSEIFRRQYQDVWADACIRAIRKSGVEFAVITDCRFPNEVEAAQGAGGRVVRLSRVVFPEDKHISETSLDPDRYDWKNFDEVIYNSHMTIERQCWELYRILRTWGWLPEIEPVAILQIASEIAGKVAA